MCNTLLSSEEFIYICICVCVYIYIYTYIYIKWYNKHVWFLSLGFRLGTELLKLVEFPSGMRERSVFVITNSFISNLHLY